MVFKTAWFGKQDPVCSVLINSNGEKIRCPNLSDLIVNGKIIIGKKGEGNLVRFSKMIDFKGAVPGTDPDQFEVVFKFSVVLDFVVQLV